MDKDPLDLKQSKFLGKPYIPEGFEYPRDRQGKPLLLLVQINFSDIPKLPDFPQEGILQLYLSPNEWCDETNNAKIVFFEGDDLHKQQSEVPVDINIDSYEDLPIWKIHSLGFNKSIDTGNSEDCQFSFDFSGEGYWDFEEKLSDTDRMEFENYFDVEGHKIGGYATFTQSDPRNYGKNQRGDIQLLQIDTDDEIMFGDSGVGHLFISPKHLKNRELNKAYFYWDCC